MPTYATVNDFETYMGPLWQTEEEADVSAIMDRAEQDINEYVGNVLEISGFSLTAMSAESLLALKLATCMQTEYRLIMGEPFFVGAAQFNSGPDAEVKRIPNKVSMACRNMLIRSGLVKLTGRFT